MSLESVSISTLIQKNAQQNTQYNWVGVLEFLHEYSQNSIINQIFTQCFTF